MFLESSDLVGEVALGGLGRGEMGEREGESPEEIVHPTCVFLSLGVKL